MTRVTGADGAEDTQRSYHPFGEIATEATSDLTAAPESIGFIGERYDIDAGLQYLNACYYDPELGLFLQPDWFEVTKAGVGTNKYAYSGNDPMNMRVPGGNDFLGENLAAHQNSTLVCLRKNVSFH